jgi:hypothetical protein
MISHVRPTGENRAIAVTIVASRIAVCYFYCVSSAEELLRVLRIATAPARVVKISS